MCEFDSDRAPTRCRNSSNDGRGLSLRVRQKYSEIALSQGSRSIVNLKYVRQTSSPTSARMRAAGVWFLKRARSPRNNSRRHSLNVYADNGMETSFCGPG